MFNCENCKYCINVHFKNYFADDEIFNGCNFYYDHIELISDIINCPLNKDKEKEEIKK